MHGKNSCKVYKKKKTDRVLVQYIIILELNSRKIVKNKNVINIILYFKIHEKNIVHILWT
jgi:hypothetical protein